VPEWPTLAPSSVNEKALRVANGNVDSQAPPVRRMPRMARLAAASMSLPSGRELDVDRGEGDREFVLALHPDHFSALRREEEAGRAACRHAQQFGGASGLDEHALEHLALGHRARSHRQAPSATLGRNEPGEFLCDFLCHVG